MQDSTTKVKPIPEGYHTITPFLTAHDAAGLIKFMKKAFHAKLNYLMEAEDGMIRHAELKIGDSVIMVSSGNEAHAPMPAMLQMYVEDCDSVYDQAIKAGGESVSEPANQFYGDRSGGVKDKWGNFWWISTHVEDVSEDELQRRASSQKNS